MELKWGIVGCGRISSDFSKALANCQNANKLVAVATSNSLDRAKEFAEKLKTAHKNPIKSYGSYAEIFQDPEIDVIYVGVLNHQHVHVVLEALDNGKHVLCEKPMGVNALEVRKMVEKAREKKRFFMEAYWSRFFPSWQNLRQKLPEIGGAELLQCDFGYNLPVVNEAELSAGGGALLAIGCYAVLFSSWVFNDEKPNKVIGDPEFIEYLNNKSQLKLGGGILLAYGCYPFMLASWIFKNEKPKNIYAYGGLGDNKTDTWASVILEYSGNRIANLFYSSINNTACSALVSGPNGFLKV